MKGFLIEHAHALETMLSHFVFQVHLIGLSNLSTCVISCCKEVIYP